MENRKTACPICRGEKKQFFNGLLNDSAVIALRKALAKAEKKGQDRKAKEIQSGLEILEYLLY